MKLIAMKTRYIDRAEWRWQIKAKNGKIVCVSSEGFKALAKCRKNASLTYEALWNHEIPPKNEGDFQIEFSNESDLNKGKK